MYLVFKEKFKTFSFYAVEMIFVLSINILILSAKKQSILFFRDLCHERR